MLSKNKKNTIANKSNNTIKKSCPNCKSKKITVRNIELNILGIKVVLKNPRRLYFEDLFEEDEIVGIACENCGFVFFMLKKFL